MIDNQRQKVLFKEEELTGRSRLEHFNISFLFVLRKITLFDIASSEEGKTLLREGDRETRPLPSLPQHHLSTMI